MSAFLTWNGFSHQGARIYDNASLLELIRSANWQGQTLAIEAVASYGMPVGMETFDTVEWSGRFREAAEMRGATVVKVFRREVKIHLCGSMKAKDANVAQSLRDKHGGSKKGEPLHGITSHLYAALGVADYVLTKEEK